MDGAVNAELLRAQLVTMKARLEQALQDVDDLYGQMLQLLSENREQKAAICAARSEADSLVELVNLLVQPVVTDDQLRARVEALTQMTKLVH